MVYRKTLIKCSSLVFVVTVIASACIKINAGKVVSLKNVKSSNGSSSIELVHVLFRHGPRTPVNTYPNDPYANDTFFPYGWGHLTNDAKKELFKIGKDLAARYEELLQPYYKPDIIYAQSSESPRTMMSMSMVLAGLLPPVNTPMEWNFKLNWQPIPVFSKPAETDIWLRMTAKCPRYDQALQEVLQQSEVLEELGVYKTMFEELTNITGLNISTAADINSLYITLLAEESYGLTLPSWARQYYPDRLQFLAEQNYVYNAYTMEMQRIKGGPFLEKIFEQMQGKVQGTLSPRERKMFLYCGHDWTIVNILSALNVWKRQMPSFSAVIAFELHQHKETKEYFVEIYFQNGPKSDFEPLTVPGCSFKCPLEKLLQLTQDVMPNAAYEEMCRLK
ncbi:venom acid phosphatase Acph-1-like [Haematobia irritans]|uniref:venom acid phosphatase Acph-1-like n=1 Tax=Haematobia irritans TaxID=7368 RepID=UPI003F4F4429